MYDTPRRARWSRSPLRTTSHSWVTQSPKASWNWGRRFPYENWALPTQQVLCPKTSPMMCLKTPARAPAREAGHPETWSLWTQKLLTRQRIRQRPKRPRRRIRESDLGLHSEVVTPLTSPWGIPVWWHLLRDTSNMSHSDRYLRIFFLFGANIVAFILLILYIYYRDIIEILKIYYYWYFIPK